MENTARSCSTRFSSPTEERSRSASSGRCASSGSARSRVYSEGDRAALHVAYADEAFLLGPTPAAESYLAIDRILDAAQRAGAQAVHPGYGFLAENAAFAQAVEDAGLVWIGPPPAAIELMGIEDRAPAPRCRRRASRSSPGTTDPVGSVDELLALGERARLPAPDQGRGGRRRQGHGGSATTRRRRSRRSSARGGRGSRTSRTRTSTSRS